MYLAFVSIRSMRTPIRSFGINLLCLYLLTQFDRGFSLSGSWDVYAYAALLLTIINTFIKPIVKILFLPINMLTLGVFSWVINIATLYLLTRIVPQIHIINWHFEGFKSTWIALPSFTFSPLLNFVFVSLSLSFLARFFHWLSK